MYLINLQIENITDLIIDIQLLNYFEARSYFVIFFQDGVNLKSIVNALFHYYIYNVVLINTKNFNVHTYVPFKYENLHQKVKILKITNCFDDVSKEALFPNKVPEFWRNTTLKIITLEFRPHVINNDVTNNNVHGSEFTLMKELKSYIKYKKLEITGSCSKTWGKKVGHNNYTKCFGDIMNKKADTGLGFFYSLETKCIDFDATHYIAFIELVWTLPMAREISIWTSFAYMSSKELYATQLFYMVILCLAFAFIGRLKHSTKPILSWISTFLNSTIHSSKYNANTTSQRLVILTINFYSIIISTFITGLFITYLSRAVYEPQIKTTKDVIDNNLVLNFNPDYLEYITKNDTIYYQVQKNYKPCKHYSCALCKEENNCVGLLSRGEAEYYQIQKYFDKTGRPTIYISKERMWAPFSSWFFFKGHPMLAKFDKGIHYFQQGGFVDYYYKSTMFKSRLKYQKNIKDNDKRSLDLRPIFYMLIPCYTFSFIVFLVEVVWFRCTKH
ncbi:unnamed protein product [Brassicogethes aeneus]|uniref:Uncharacterized protein n=1 Tax=Brassicogethes aeneus TaxID=1431903 RepID=A0A9P0BDQ7_BRAAE|nr:unnamed protein product [Brassicogethes aeneus]